MLDGWMDGWLNVELLDGWMVNSSCQPLAKPGCHYHTESLIKAFLASSQLPVAGCFD